MQSTGKRFGRQKRGWARLWMLMALALAAWPAYAATGPSALAAGQQRAAVAAKELIYVSDGMRPDLVAKYVAAGSMPNYGKILSDGVTSENGMVPQFPPNTGAGWTAIASGAYADATGSVNNTFHIVSNGILTTTSPYNMAVIQAETYGEVAEKAGKKVAVIDWPGVMPNTKIKGPVADFNNFYSGRGVIANYPVPGALPNFVRDFGLVYTDGLQIADAAGWTGAPQSFSPAKEASFTFNTNVISGTAAPLVWPLYIYDSTDDGQVNYDHMLVAKATKDAGQKVADLKVGDWQDVKLTLPQNGLLVGFYLKLIDLSPDLSKVRIYFTSLSRVRANMPDLEDKIATDFPAVTSSDFGPLEAGISDSQTYVEQGLKWYDTWSKIQEHIITTYSPDVVLAGYPTTDEFSHQFMALSMPDYSGPRAAGTPDAATAESYIKMAYMQADESLGHLWSLLGSDTVTFVASDHGFAPAWRSVNVNQVLQDAGLYDPANRGKSQAVGYVAGGTANIYINLTGREIGGVVTTTQYSAVQSQIIDAFNNLDDSGTKVAAAVWKKDETKAIQAEGYTINAWHPTRTGDVVVVLKPPYQWDAPTTGQRIADSPFYGQHGYLPDTVDLSKNINMHAMFGIYGPGIAKGKKIAVPRTIDIAPTAAYALGILAPRGVEGRVLTDAFADSSSSLVSIKVLSWSDYHGQLDPVTRTVDGVSVPTGGVAAIAGYWNQIKAQNPNGTIMLASGDNIGATPPNSAFLGDKPIIEAMNMMGFTASAIGNHEFDRGRADLESIIALAKFPYLADNIVDTATGQPASFTKPYIVVQANGIDVGIIGVGNPDTPTVVKPDAVAGLSFTDPVASTNNYVKELVGKGVKTIIVVYHQGATSGDFDNQTGPLAELAKGLDPEVDLLIGGHNRVETLTRINGILTHEANNAMSTGDFTLLVDPQTKDVVYSYGRFLRPSVGGVTPDPDLAALVKQANDAIKPILGQEVGTAAALVDRSRGAESKMGNLVSDAIRATYQVDVALQNSGGLRADFQPGPLTRGDVFAVLPFGNLVVTGDLKGSDLLAALENGVSDVSGTAGRFIQLSGLRFAYDASKPVGQRVLWAVFSDGKPVDPNATYKVATNDFMTTGGDGYTSLTRMANKTSREILFDVAANYIQSLGTIDPQVEGRINPAQAGQPAPTPPTAATPALPTPAGGPPAGGGGTGSPTAVPPTVVPPSVSTPLPPAPTQAPAPPTEAPLPPTAAPPPATPAPPPGMPTTGAPSDPTGAWLLLVAALAVVAGLFVARRRPAR